MRRLARCVPALLLLVLGAGSVAAFSSGPPASRTNALGFGIYPAEANCTQCHTGNALNDPNGKVEVLDAPFRYMAGQSYPMRVRLSYSLADTTGASNPKWGFELTAVKGSDGTGAGTIIAPNPGSAPTYPDSLLIKVATSGTYATSGRQYIEHSTFSTRTDQPTPVEWHFTWVAPDPSVGRVYFFVTGNAANGNASSSGDHIFTGSDSTDVIGPGVPATGTPTAVALVLLLASLGAGVLINRRRPA